MPFSARIVNYTDDNLISAERESYIDSDQPSLCSTHYVIIHRLSPLHSAVEAYHGLYLGGQVEIDIPGLGKRIADVKSQDGALYECVFTEPFDSQEVRNKKLSTKVVWPAFGKRLHGGKVVLFDPPNSLLRAASLSSPDERYSGIVRISVIFGSAAFLWGVLITITAALSRLIS